MESESDTFFFRNDKHARGYSVIDSVYASRKLEGRHVLSMFYENCCSTVLRTRHTSSPRFIFFFFELGFGGWVKVRGRVRSRVELQRWDGTKRKYIVIVLK